MRAVAASVALCLALVAAGCYDSREPNDLVYGLALGFDIDDEGRYIAAIQFANPAAVRQAGTSSSPSSGSGSQAYWTYSAVGHTPAEAIAALSPHLARDLALTHIEVLLLSERLARHGIAPIIDYLARNWQTRLTISGAVVDGDLMDLLRAESPMDAVPALSMRRMLGRMRTADFATVSSDVLTAVTRLVRTGSDLILPVLKVANKESGRSSQPTQSSQPLAKAPFANLGAAVFLSDRMVAFIDQKEARGSGFVLGGPGPVSIHVDSPRGGLLSIRLVDLGTRVIPSFSGGQVSFVIRASASGYIEAKPSSKESTRDVLPKRDLTCPTRSSMMM